MGQRLLIYFTRYGTRVISNSVYICYWVDYIERDISTCNHGPVSSPYSHVADLRCS